MSGNETEAQTPGDQQTTDGDDGALSDLGIGWVAQLEGLAKRPKAWVVATIAGISVDSAANRMSGDDGSVAESAAQIIVEGYLYRQLLLPIAISVYNAGMGVLDAVLVLFLGGDRAVGWEDGSTIGLADIPFVLVTQPIRAWEALSSGAVESLMYANAYMASMLSPFGIAAPAIIAGLWTVELFVFGYGVWLIVQFTAEIDPTDITGGLLGAAQTASRPVVNVLRRLV